MTGKDDSTDRRAMVSRRAGSVAVRDGAPNPQGKGAVGFLLDWDYSSPKHLPVKRTGQVLADYFTSLLVLSARFRFKPAFGNTYHLYREDEDWLLSLVSPEEWNRPEKYAGYVGACVLHDDSTWSIEPSDNIGQPGPVTDGLAEMYQGFLDKLSSDRALEDDLPVYEATLPYYQRLFASALSRSIRGSLQAGGQTGRAGSNWLAALPGDANKLLGGG